MKYTIDGQLYEIKMSKREHSFGTFYNVAIYKKYFGFILILEHSRLLDYIEFNGQSNDKILNMIVDEYKTKIHRKKQQEQKFKEFNKG